MNMQSDSHPLMPRNSETILIADDNTNLLEIISEILEVFGYDVLCAESGRQAEAVYIEHADKISMALLDIEMPVVNGFETACRLLKHNALLPILFFSGYASISPPKGIEHIPVLKKPINPVDLCFYVNGFLKKKKEHSAV